MILIVDDDPSVTASLALLLKQTGYASHAVASPPAALQWLEREPCELVLQDMNFSRRTSGEEGLELLARVKALRSDLPVILITAWGSIALAVAGMKAGASDFVTKPWTNEQILHAVRTALGLAATKAPPAEGSVPTRDELDARYDFGSLIGRDPRLLRMLDVVGRVSATDASVLITGESGTGKELVAEVYRRDRLAISPQAMRWLQGLAWPGNVRQLRQWIERTVLVSPKSVLESDDFAATAEMEQPEARQDTLPPVGSMTMDEIERVMILKSLRFHAGNISRVAESLGLSRAALYRRFEKYGISV